MWTTTFWMVLTIGLLVGAGVFTLEETVRRRAACIRFQHELRRGAYHPVGTGSSPRHLRLVRAGGHRKAA